MFVFYHFQVFIIFYVNGRHFLIEKDSKETEFGVNYEEVLEENEYNEDLDSNGMKDINGLYNDYLPAGPCHISYVLLYRAVSEIPTFNAGIAAKMLS